MMEFKYLNQPDFNWERGEAYRRVVTERPWRNRVIEPLEACMRCYNEGFKACLKFIQKEYWNPDIPDAWFEAITEEVDKIDKRES
jgi:hypothetical protein